MKSAAFFVLIFASSALAQSITDSNLRIQRWVKGLDQPTGLAFIDNAGTALALEKATGRVRVISGKTITGTALDLPVASDSERGLLGIALSPTFATDHFVYLYYTRAANDGGSPTDNRIERYTWNGSTLAFNRKIISLPATPGPNHNGGRIAFGPDGKLYAVIGELNRNELTSNFENSGALNRIGSILRLNPSGSNVWPGRVISRTAVLKAGCSPSPTAAQIAAPRPDASKRCALDAGRSLEDLRA